MLSQVFPVLDTVDPIPDNDIPLGMYPTIVTQKSGKKVPVVQAYAFTKYIGRLLLSFDDNGDLTSIEGRPLLLDKTVPEGRPMEYERPARRVKFASRDTE